MPLSLYRVHIPTGEYATVIVQSTHTNRWICHCLCTKYTHEQVNVPLSLYIVHTPTGEYATAFVQSTHTNRWMCHCHCTKYTHQQVRCMMYFLYSVCPAITSYIIVLVPFQSFILLLRILLSALPMLTKKVASYYIFHCGSHLTSIHFVYSNVYRGTRQ